MLFDELEYVNPLCTCLPYPALDRLGTVQDMVDHQSLSIINGKRNNSSCFLLCSTDKLRLL